MRLGAALAALFVVALAIRLPRLEARPMHGDEANQAVKTGILIDEGRYEYDPRDHHGPTLYYFARISALLRGEHAFAETTETTFRVVPVLFGAGMLPLLYLLRGALPSGALLLAGTLIAISPANVYYSRYFIQETPLLFFTLGAMGCAWRYTQDPRPGWALALGLMIGLMQATKETAVIAYFSAAVPTAGLFVWRQDRAALPWRRYSAHALAALGVALTVAVAFYTSFFMHWTGALDAIRSYGFYLERSGGAGLHDKPWHYYLALLAYTHRGPGGVFSEGLILVLAVVGVVRVLGWEHRQFGVFLCGYTFLMTAVYAIIPYKTPWTALGFFQGMILLAGIGAYWTLSHPRELVRLMAPVLLAAGFAHLGYQTWRTSYDIPADPRNPYVYAHTSSAFMRLAGRAEDLAALHPAGHNMIIFVVQPDHDYWPIPWYLRRFPNTGYFSELPEIPASVHPAMIITSMQSAPQIANKLGESYVSETHSLRPAVLRVAFIDRGLWDAYMANRR